MKRHQDSHLDHGLSEAQIEYFFDLFADQNAFFIETITLPVELGKVSCGLWGPAMGDPVIRDGSEVLPLKPGEYVIPAGTVGLKMEAWWRLPSYTGAISLAKRGTRAWDSRLIDLPSRPTRLVTVIAGPLLNDPCVLYTAFGGPAAPREPLDSDVPADKLPESTKFWLEHALSKYTS